MRRRNLKPHAIVSSSSVWRQCVRAIAWGAAVVLAFGTLTGITEIAGSTSTAHAVPGAPGQTFPPEVVFEEDFEHQLADEPIKLPNYLGVTGMSYWANQAWLQSCNGIILRYTSPDAAQSGAAVNNCAPTSTTPVNNAIAYDNIRRLAWALGVRSGNETSNHVVSAYTQANPGANRVQFATVNPITLPTATGRFLTFSVDTAAVNCWRSGPEYVFSLQHSDGSETQIGDVVNACVGGTSMTPPALRGTVDEVYLTSLSSNGSFLFDGSTLGIVMRNANGSGAGNDAAFDNIRILDVTPQLDKSFAPSSVSVGGTTTLTFTVTGADTGTGVSGWQFTDTLPDGLSVAADPGIGGSCAADTAAVAGGHTISVSNGILNAGQGSCTITVSITSEAPRGAAVSPIRYENCASNVSDLIGIDAPGCATVDFYSEPKLAIEKSSNAEVNGKVGQTIEYSIRLSNNGTGDFTASNPATFSDDLRDVLDDAVYNSDASISFSAGSTALEPTLSGSSLEWSGPLQAGEVATVTYSVKLNNLGNGLIKNSACVPEAFAADGQACAVTTTKLPKLSISKTSSVAELPLDGETVNYEITVTNEGPGDTTIDNLAAFHDDLSDVLDDGNFVDSSLLASTGTAQRVGNQLSWSGELAAGSSASVSYEVAYESEKGGDQILRNKACVPDALVRSRANACTIVQVPGAALQQWKTSEPAAGNVVAGSTITYTLHFKNTGQTSASVHNRDDLANVLDGALLVSGPSVSDPNLVVGIDGGVVEVSGEVPPGAEYTVSYAVEVLQASARGNSVLINELEQCDSITANLCDPTQHTIPHLSVEKTANVQAAQVGDVVRYTVTVKNDGTGDFTVQNPATLTDDLSEVIDDAVYNDDAAATSGKVKYNEAELNWSGPLQAGDSVTITYSVTVTSEGDHQLRNSACVRTEGELSPACAHNTVLLPALSVSKSSDPSSGTAVQAGQTVTYTLSFANDGLAPSEVRYTDDLSDLLDDASLVSGPTASSSVLSVTRNAESLSISGVVPVNETVTVQYSFLVNADGLRGNNSLANLLAGDGTAQPRCADRNVICTESAIGELRTWKSVDPATGTSLRAGEEARYTLHLLNSGTAEVPVDVVDVLSKVLDDADIVAGPTSTSTALQTSLVQDQLTVVGTLAVGEYAAVNYTVRVKSIDQIGDGRLANFLVRAGEEPPTHCENTGDPFADCTENYVSDVTAAKTSDPKPGSPVHVGQTVTYLLTFTNKSESAAAAPSTVDYTDHLADVLDDAQLVSGPTVSNSSLQATVTANAIRITGSVPPGESYTVSYAVKVKPYQEQGNHRLLNILGLSDASPHCVSDSPLCTGHPATPTLPNTGSTAEDPALSAITLLVLGGALVLISVKARRRPWPSSE